MSAALTPRPHQVSALADLVAAFALRDRVQLVMACGTGKTLVGRWHAEASEARRVLVLVPSLALLGQTLQEWRRDRSWPFEALVVCSDPTTSAGAGERSTDGSGVDDDLAVPDWAAVRARVTTSPAEAESFLRRVQSERAQVVFSTYHSAPVVAAAQQASGAVFDLVICDLTNPSGGRACRSREWADHRSSVLLTDRARVVRDAAPRKDSGGGASGAGRDAGSGAASSRRPPVSHNRLAHRRPSRLG